MNVTSRVVHRQQQRLALNRILSQKTLLLWAKLTKPEKKKLNST